MNRTLGFFLGSAVVFAGLVLILGQPVPLAPPADRDRLPGADASATTAMHSTAQQQADLEAPSSLRSSVPPVPVPTAPSAQQQTPAADVVSPPDSMTGPDRATEPPVIEDRDERELVEAWLASSPLPSSDDAVVDSATDDKQLSATEGSIAAQAAAEVSETAWFPLWDPFHSELSANAFARRLERVTGLDYRVIKTAPAEYRVTVGYRSEDQRIANLNLIEEATGLSLSGGSL